MKIIELVRKEYVLFKRNKKQVWTVILLPLLFSLIYLFMFSSSNINLDLTICNMDSGEYSNILISSIISSFNAQVFESDSLNECVSVIESDIQKGVMLGIVIDDSFSESIRRYESPTLKLYFDNSKPNLGFFAQNYILNKINSFNSLVLRQTEELIKSNTNTIESDLKSTMELLTVMNYSVPVVIRDGYDKLYYNINDYHNKISALNAIDLEFLVHPVYTQLVGVFDVNNSRGFSFSVLYIVLNILVLLLLSSVSMVYDKNNFFPTRLKTSNTPIIFYILAKVVFFSTIGFIIFIPSFLLFMFDNAYFNINILTLVIALLLINAVSSLIGCVIGLSSKNEASSTMLSFFIGFMFLLLSGLFYPVELLPSAIKAILVVLPTNAEINMLNNGLVLNTDISVLTGDVFYLITYLVVLVGINHYLIWKD